MSFAKGTTPTISIRFSEEKYPTLDLTEAEDVIVTLSSRGKKLNKTKEDLSIEQRSINVFLSQEETFKFDVDAKIQANWLMPDGKRFATVIKAVPVGEQLYERVMHNE